MSALTEIDSSLFRAAFDASPIAMLVVDHDVDVLDLNRAAGALADASQNGSLRRRGGDLLRCLHAQETPEGCGRAEACQDCPVRAAVDQALAGQPVLRRKAPMELVAGGKIHKATFLVSASPFEHQGRHLALLSMEDVTDLVTLRGLLPICANCKKIRSDQNYWVAVEEYFRQHVGADFTHCICPDCAMKLYPDLLKD